MPTINVDDDFFEDDDDLFEDDDDLFDDDEDFEDDRYEEEALQDLINDTEDDGPWYDPQDGRY